MKLGTKIIIAFSFIAIISVFIIGAAGITIGKKTMKTEAFEKLTAIRELKANRIEAYFEQIRNQLLSFSENYMVVEAMNDFQKAFYEIEKGNVSANEAEIDESLTTYYKSEYLPKLNANSIVDFQFKDFYPIDRHTKYLQYLYISQNQNPTGEKHLLIESSDESRYSNVHSIYHPIFKSFLEKFGYYDVFLIDTKGHIVYSVYKEVDFATSLKEDAYKETNLAKVANEALSSGHKDFVKMVDFENYPPSYNGHASFIASPIYDGDKKIGALVFQLPIDRINNIMTDNQQWAKVGLGTSGETYIVGEDLFLRNQSRFLIEDKANYILLLDNLGISDDTIGQIENLNNSIGLQKVPTLGVKNALKGDTGVKVFLDYRGIPVLSSYRPLTIKDVNWVIMSELDEEEAFSAIDSFITNMVSWSLLLILLIPLVAIYFSRGLTKPLIKLTGIAKQMAAGNLGTETGLCRNDEIGALACSFDTMSESIKQMMDKLEEANNTLEEKVVLRTKEVEVAHYKIQSIIDNANDAIITIDENQDILLFNPAASNIFGYKNEEIIGTPLLELLPDAMQRNHQKHINSFKDSSEGSRQMSQRTEVLGKRKDGELFYAEVSISKQKIEDKFQFTAFLKDITERKEAEERIKISENMFRSISSSASDAIISVNQNGTIEFWNDAAEQIFGFENEEVIGKNLDLIVPAVHIDNHNAGLARVAGGGEKKMIGKTIETQAKRKDGELFPIELSISNWEGKTGMNFSSIIRDITERKDLELKIEEANARMEDELKVGRDIQMSMLPLIFPAFPDNSEFNIFALLESAREVGGDFYDFYFIDENKFLFTIADVSGKGVPSALFMAVCKTLIKSRASEDAAPSSIITHVNEELSRENPSSMFVTLFLCIIDLSTGELSYTNAGHNPPHIKRINGEIETLNKLHGPVLGALEDFAYGEDTVKLEVNDYMILFTDGVNEAMDKDKNLFGDVRLVEILKEDTSDNINDHVKALYNSVMEFQGEAEQADDITILGFEYLEPLTNKVLISKAISLKNELDEIDRLNNFFEEFCETNQIPPSTYRKFNIVFDEIINNIVSYAYNDDEAHEIEVVISLTEDQLVISIEDDGIAFNPFNLATPDTSASIEDREIGGLGIHLVKNLMDNYSYKRFVKRNMTTLYKKLN